MTDTMLYPRKRPPMYTRERDAFLRDNPNVDPHILADAMGLAPISVYRYQRRLGLRICTWHDHGTGDNAK
jgi:hypothetical protein